MANKDTLGRRGEQLAADYLRRAGYRVIARNWRCRHGEIDLVVGSGERIVFVEVKTRSSLAYGHPFEAITAEKLARLRRLTGAWFEVSGARRSRVRIDAIAVVAPPGAEARIEHRTGVF